MSENEKYSTIQQHQPLRIPASFDKQGRALILQLDEIFDDIYRRFGRLRVQDLGTKLKDLCLIKDEDGNYTSISGVAGELKLEIGDIEGNVSDISLVVGGILLQVSDIDGVMTEIGMSRDGIDMLGKHIKIKAGSLFEVESDGQFKVASENIDIDETGLAVKKGTLKGEHYTTDGVPLLSSNDIVVSTEPPDGVDGRIWVKPLDSSAVNYREAIAGRQDLDGYTGTLVTNGAIPTAPGGTGATYSYRLKFPVHVETSSGTGTDVTATVGGLAFTKHINQGDYNTGFDRTFDVTVTSGTWIADVSQLAISVSASGGYVAAYKINVGSIELTASYSGSSGSGWKNCEVKVYKE